MLNVINAFSRTYQLVIIQINSDIVRNIIPGHGHDAIICCLKVKFQVKPERIYSCNRQQVSPLMRPSMQF